VWHNVWLLVKVRLYRGNLLSHYGAFDNHPVSAQEFFGAVWEACSVSYTFKVNSSALGAMGLDHCFDTMIFCLIIYYMQAMSFEMYTHVYIYCCAAIALLYSVGQQL